MSNCSNCVSYEEIHHRGQKYRRGKCKLHKMSRIPDGYEVFLSISDPDNFRCSEFKEKHIHKLYVNVDGNLECFNEDCEFFMEKDRFMEILSNYIQENE